MTAVGTTARVFLRALPAVKATDIHMIAACPFMIGTKPSPCVTGSQFTPATRVFIEGIAAVLNTSIGLGKSIEQAPQGPASFTGTQVNVIGM